MFGLSDNNRQVDSQNPASDPSAANPANLLASSKAPDVTPLSSSLSASAPTSSPGFSSSPEPSTESSTDNPTADSGSVSPDPTYNPIDTPNDDTPSQPADSPLPKTNPKINDLLNLKQQALQSLSPLVGQLDQSAEEKFKTTMMLIQASDNPELVNEAYEAANQIEDEKIRAHALLDVVNEINYFTQHNQEDHQEEA